MPGTSDSLPFVARATLATERSRPSLTTPELRSNMYGAVIEVAGRTLEIRRQARGSARHVSDARSNPSPTASGTSSVLQKLAMGLAGAEPQHRCSWCAAKRWREAGELVHPESPTWKVLKWPRSDDPYLHPSHHRTPMQCSYVLKRRPPLL